MKQTKRVQIKKIINVTSTLAREITFDIDLSYTPAKIFGKDDDLHKAVFDAELVNAIYNGKDVSYVLNEKEISEVIGDAWHEFDYE